MSILERKPRTKKWSTIYTEKIEQQNGKNRKKLDSQPSMDKLSTLWAKTLLAKKMVKRVRAKLQAKEFTCKKTLDNIHPPGPLGEWKSHWGSQTMCNICETPAIFDCLVCKTCDIVVHISCVEQMDIEKRYRIQTIKNKDSDDFTLELRCAECAEHAKAEVDYYNREREKLIKDRERMLLARKIAKRMITYTIRQRFKRQRAVTILVQSLIRKHMIRKKFGQWRRNQIRVVSIELVQAPKLDNGLVVWTIVDTFKNIQLFRLDKQLNKSEDGNR